MKRLSAKSQYKTISQLTALILCFWMSGMICVVSCCAARRTAVVTKQPTTSEAVRADISCPMHGQAAAPSKNSDKLLNSFVASPRNAPRFDCCVLATFFINAAQNIGQTDVSVFVGTALIKLDFAPVSKSRRIPPQINYQTVSRSCRDTYLRNCVFLI